MFHVIIRNEVSLIKNANELLKLQKKLESDIFFTNNPGNNKIIKTILQI